MAKPKALVLYSGGLDSRLALMLLKKQGYEPVALHFKLPFGCGCSQKQNIKLTLLDVTKPPLLAEYLKIITKPLHGTGTGINPCRDCKIWMFKTAKKYADKHNIKYIATGEVLGQRPMSQTRSALDIIDKKIGFKIHRPLIELGIHGRSRNKQIKLAKKFKIKYPSPGGGCLLCEKQLVKRFQFLLNNKLINKKTLPLTKIGRHFSIKGNWFIVARNESESILIEKFKNSLKSGKGKPAVYFHTTSEKNKKLAVELQKAYETRNPKKFLKFKL